MITNDDIKKIIDALCSYIYQYHDEWCPGGDILYCANCKDDYLLLEKFKKELNNESIT
jgi:hypothetical protein